MEKIKINEIIRLKPNMSLRNKEIEIDLFLDYLRSKILNEL